MLVAAQVPDIAKEGAMFPVAPCTLTIAVMRRSGPTDQRGNQV